MIIFLIKIVVQNLFFQRRPFVIPQITETLDQLDHHDIRSTDGERKMKTETL